MTNSRIPILILTLGGVVIMLGVSSWLSPSTLIPLQGVTPTSTSAMPPKNPGSWIIVDLPPDATQLEYGTEVYRLVCKACHGDKGQGLTDDWRAQWAPEDQNCWQSKCHAANHPPDGFTMPKAPAIVGQTVKGFGTALNLYNFVYTYMPWQNRGSMTEKDAWSVTAYLLKLNGIDPPLELDAETAANIDLSVIDPNLGATPVPTSSEPQLTLEVVNTPILLTTPEHENQTDNSNRSQWFIALLIIIILVFVIVFVVRRTVRPTQK